MFNSHYEPNPKHKTQHSNDVTPSIASRSRIIFATLTIAVLGFGCAALGPSRSYRAPNRAPQYAQQAPQDQARAPQDMAQTDDNGLDREGYNEVIDNPFRSVKDAPLSTFSIDVDTASYTNVRRMINNGVRPVPSAVREEEFINYFDYQYGEPTGEHPIAVQTEVASAPWAPRHHLVKIGLKGKSMASSQRPISNLVFLIDTSGSMRDENKLPLLVRGLGEMLRGLDKRDTISIVAYAGSAGVVLPPTPADDDHRIFAALSSLGAGGGTNGAHGIRLAYQLAAENFVEGGTNRVILATDGDFNVGTTSQGELISLIEKQAKSGVFLTVLGFGMGNFQDGTLELLSNKGNGNYAYIDTFQEAKKVLVTDLNQNIVTLAKDVKLQVEFNPALVSRYRLIGYSNRMLKDEDFNDDTKDAGEMGAGHTVTALYEVELRDEDTAASTAVDALRYQSDRELLSTTKTDELFTLKVRYKHPESGKSIPFVVTAADSDRNFDDASDDFRFAAAAAAFGMVLRQSEFKGSANFEVVQSIASGALGDDEHGYRKEFVELVQRAAKL